MKNNWKKWVALSGAAVMACALFAGCGGRGNTTDPIEVADELKECVVRLALPTNTDPYDWEYVQDEINLALEEDHKPYTVSLEFLDETDYAKNILLFATDGYDLAWFHSDELPGAVQANALREAGPYLEKYGKTLLENTPQYAWDCATVDGKIYTIPRSMPVSDNHYFGAARKDWMEEFGTDTDGDGTISSLQELDNYFLQTFIKFEDLEDSSGYYVHDASNHYDFLYREYCPSYYFPLVEWATKPVYIDLNAENGKYEVKNFFESDAFVEICEKTNFYYTQNYISLDQLSGSENYFNAGLLGSTWSTLFKTSERIDHFKETISVIAPDADIAEIYLNPDDTRYIVQGFENSLGLLAGGQNPNEAVDFLNWVRSSQENHDLVCYGVEGRNYELTEDGRLDFSNIDPEMRFATYMPYWCFNDIRFARYSKYLSDEYVENLKNWDKTEEEGGVVVVSDLVGFAPDMRNSELATAYKNVNAAAGESVTNLIDGKYSLSETIDGVTRYQKLLSDVETAGMQTLIDELQAQLDEFLAQI